MYGMIVSELDMASGRAPADPPIVIRGDPSHSSFSISFPVMPSAAAFHLIRSCGA